MNDKVLMYAILISVGVHLAAAGVIGKVPASRYASASVISTPHPIEVDLVSPEPPAKPKPPQAIVSSPPSVFRSAMDPIPRSWVPSGRIVSPNRVNTRSSYEPPGNPGGKLKIGSMSAHGDLPGSWQGGKTPVGWVPGSETGTGRGSGESPGVGHPEPDPNAVNGPNTHPAPPPQPKMVSAKICEASGLLPGKWCTKTRTASFVSGSEPGRTCDRCKAPEPEHKSRLADQAKPVLVRDSAPSIPASVDEGLNVTVVVEYTVTAEGGVAGVQVIKSSGVRAVDRAVAASASELKYKPAVQDGIPRAVKMTRSYTIRT